jgi:hypothetical protein
MYVKLSVGTTPTPLFVNQLLGQNAVDFIIQNNSANTLVLMEEASNDTGNGILVPAGASISKDFWQRNLWLLASAAGSEIRVMYQTYPTVSKVDP